MAIFHIVTTTPSPTGAGRVVTMHVEAPHDSVDDFVAAAQTSYLIAVDRLSWAEDGRGGRLIKSRERMGLGVLAIASVQVDRFRYWEPDFA